MSFFKWVELFAMTSWFGIELSGVSENGAICIYNWILSQPKQFVGEWNWSIQNNLPLLRRIISSGYCRILITTKGKFTALTKSNLLLFKGDGMSRVNLQIERGITLPLTLSGNKLTKKSSYSSRFIPANAIELNQFLNGQTIDNSFSVEDNSDSSSQIWRAIELLPEGDAEYANSVEREYNEIFILIGFGLGGIVLSLISGLLVLGELDMELIFKIVFTGFALIIYMLTFLGVKYANLKVRYAVRGTILSFAMVLLAYFGNTIFLINYL